MWLNITLRDFLLISFHKNTFFSVSPLYKERFFFFFKNSLDPDISIDVI